MTNLKKQLKRYQRDVHDADVTIEQAKDVTEFWESIGEAAKGLTGDDFLKTLEQALPWAGVVVEAAGETLPVVKFVLKLLDKVTEVKDPHLLASLAANLAFEKCTVNVLKEVGPPAEPALREVPEVQEKLKALVQEDLTTIPFEDFELDRATRHAFFRRSLEYSGRFMTALGYTQAQQIDFATRMEGCFGQTLNEIVSHKDALEKFEPFREYQALPKGARTARLALRTHLDKQLRQFSREPLFNVDPFALADIYQPMDCGVVKWSQVREITRSGGARWGERYALEESADEAKKANPFDESFGGRQDLGDAVLDLLKDKDYAEAVVIQGVAGAGKSAFTLWLCDRLQQDGLIPVRIRMRDLPLTDTGNLFETLSAGLNLPEDMDKPADAFVNGDIFNLKVTHGEATISPYVIILDGWDEINVTASEGYSQRVDKLMSQVQDRLLSRKVRVILTGRPSKDVNKSPILKGETQLLTVRPMHPDTLAALIESLAELLNAPPLDVPHDWQTFNASTLESVVQRYTATFKEDRDDQTFEILGLPLLAYLSLRLLTRSDADPDDLLRNPTSLFRQLVDLTCKKAGKADVADYDSTTQHRVTGADLRRLLWHTASAITVYGNERIPNKELRLRLKHYDAVLYERLTEDEIDPVAGLLISYYFKLSQDDLGAEFFHKSFREYLFAEAIVALLKEYGAEVEESLPEKRADRFWKDFDSSDERYSLVRELAERLAAHWLSRAERDHLRELISWEVQREQKLEGETEHLALDGWRIIRDGLADLWDWWGEGVHLRPQPELDEREFMTLRKPAYVYELTKEVMPKVPPEGEFLPPPRSVTLDAHLGDALFHFASLTHSEIASAEGWQPDRKGDSPPYRPSRRYQVRQRSFFFRPSGENRGYLSNYIARINAAGWYRAGSFPANANLRSAFLEEVYLRGANLRNADLHGAYLYNADLTGADLRDADLRDAVLSYAKLGGANLRGADLRGAEFIHANLGHADLSNTKLNGAGLEDVYFAYANLTSADLSDTYFRQTSLGNAQLFDAVLKDATLQETDLRNAHSLTVEQLSEAKTLYRAQLNDGIKVELLKLKPELFS